MRVPNPAKTRATAILIAGLALALLAGCGGSSLWKPPLSVSANGDYAQTVPPAVRTTQAHLFYATDRQSRADLSPGSRYGAKRALALMLGVATLRFGERDWSWDELAQRTAEGDSVPLALLDVHEFGTLPSTVPPRVNGAAASHATTTTTSAASPDNPASGVDEFARQIDVAMDQTGQRTITIFVHGFNTSFTGALYRAAGLWQMSARRGVVITYSWPAHDHPFSYEIDRESGALTARSLREFILMLAEHTRVERINLLTYSAGAPTLAAALHQLRLMYANDPPETVQRSTRIGQIVFAGADLDPDLFTIATLDRLQDLARHVTLYTSSSDMGLVLADLFYYDDARLGRADRPLTPEGRAALLGSGANVIDVTYAQRRAGGGDMWSHGYWYGNAWVSSDLIHLLLTDDDPATRGLVRNGDDIVWRFPDDYPQRLDHARGLHGEPSAAAP